MSFKIPSHPSCWAKVALEVTGEDGRAVEGTIKLKFKRMSLDAYRDFMERTKDEKLSGNVLLDVIEDWQGAEDESGQAMPFTPENFHRMGKSVPGFYVRVAQRFWKLHTGTEDREGNS